MKQVHITNTVGNVVALEAKMNSWVRDNLDVEVYDVLSMRVQHFVTVKEEPQFYGVITYIKKNVNK